MINERQLIEFDKAQCSEAFQAERYSNALKAIATEAAKAGIKRQRRIVYMQLAIRQEDFLDHAPG